MIIVIMIFIVFIACLKFIAKALEKDEEYMKAIAFRDQIFSEQPSLEKDSASFFQAWSVNFFYFSSFYFFLSFYFL